MSDRRKHPRKRTKAHRTVARLLVAVDQTVAAARKVERLRRELDNVLVAMQSAQNGDGGL